MSRYRRGGTLSLHVVVCLGCLIVGSWIDAQSAVSAQIESTHGRVGEGKAASGTTGKSFDIATVKPAQARNGSWKMQFTVDGFTAKGVTLRAIIQEAYGIYEENRIYGGPPWLSSDKFDVEAKVDSDDAAYFRDLGVDGRRSMLRALLAERFKLTSHLAPKELPAYALTVARSGLKLKDTGVFHESHERTKGGSGCYITRSQPGLLAAQSCSMQDLTSLLNHPSGRTVVNKTGLYGLYDFSLRWTPEDNLAHETSTNASDDPMGPSIFTAVQEQLGLKLEPTKALMQVIVVDYAQLPSAN